MKGCNCKHSGPVKTVTDPVQTSASALYPDMGPTPLPPPHRMSHPPKESIMFPGIGPVPANAPIPMNIPIPANAPVPRRPHCVPPMPVTHPVSHKPHPVAPMPPPPGPAAPPPIPKPPVPEPCRASAVIKEIVIEGEGDIKVTKNESAYVTYYKIAYTGTGSNYEFEPYTLEELNSIFDAIDSRD